MNEIAGQLLGKQFNSLMSYKSTVAKIKTEVEILKADKADMLTKVRDAERKGEVISERVKNWLRRVDEIIAGSNKILTNEQGHQEIIAGSSSSQTNNQEVIAAGSNNQTNNEGHPSGSSWWKKPLDTVAAGPRLLNQSNEAQEVAQKISEIIAEGRSIQTTDISFRGSPQMTTSSFARGYKDLESRTSLLEKIKEALQDPNIYMVGVHGMGGVGKTTLMEELAYQVKQEELFGDVVRVTVTKTWDMKQVQDHLAERLRLKFEYNTEEVRAGELRTRIHNEKSILVILDDVWDPVDLTELGVPYGDDHKGCKLVVTSRELDVLTKGMGAQKCFSLDALPDEESWDLFKKTVGDVLKCRHIESIARDVAKCCAGLPLLIVIVAKSLKGEVDERVWKDSSQRLKSRSGGEMEQVIQRLRFSYDRLKSKELKSLFLLIGSLGRHGTGLDDYTDDELFSICWGLGIYQDVSMLAQARNRHHTLIKDLMSSSLLLEGGTWMHDHYHDTDIRPTLKSLLMHDCVRDMARSVASNEHPTFAVLEKFGINEWLKEDQLQNYHRIILPRYDILKLPDKLDCPELELLILRYDSLLNMRLFLPVLDNFFSRTGKVKVLQFHSITLKTLSPSFCLPGNLLSLTLYRSELEDITILGQLKSLEILIIEDCRKIKELPKELEHLTHLRMLTVNRCSGLKLIPKNILSSFKWLEELYMVDCSIKWESEGCASLGELRNCDRLSSVELTVHNGSELPKDLLNFANLEKYKISMAHPLSRPYPHKRHGRFWQNSSRALSLDRNNYTLWSDGWAKELLTKADSLLLRNWEDVQNIIPELIGVGSSKLRYLSFEKSTRLLHIVNSNNVRGLHRAFPNLENLTLQNLANMEEICHGPLPEQSFDKLTAIYVGHCDNLKNLFLRSHVRHLNQLRELHISLCGSMKEIIAEEEENDHLVLPELRSLRLANLPELLSFFSVQLADDTPPTLFNEKVSLPNLDELQIFGMNLKSLWHNQLAPNSLCKLNILVIDGYPKLLNVFPSNVLNNLQNLKRLFVKDCSELKDIFEVQDQQLQNSLCKLNEVQISGCHKLSNVFPSNVLNNLLNLERLLVKDCSELKGIFEVQDQQLQNSLCKLNVVQISGCHKLSNVFPSNVLNNLQNLKRLFVEACSELKDIFEVQDEQLQNSLCKLNEVQIGGCHKLFNVITPLMAASLSELRVLRIDNCGSMKEIVANENDGDAQREIIFRKLNQLYLTQLARLTSFCSGQYNFNFPSLEQVSVFNCPEMKTFCTGNLTTPIFKGLTRSYEEAYGYPKPEKVYRWYGDLNTIIANIFEEDRAEEEKRNKRMRWTIM